ncbi:hypothetical protein [Bacillus sp. UMB0893]|nr:hypothetical protein [Bacillus sp. UMB0893]
MSIAKMPTMDHFIVSFFLPINVKMDNTRIFVLSNKGHGINMVI